MKLRLIIIALLSALTLTSFAAKKKIKIYTIGDSTMADKDISKGSPERGWGMVLQGCFSEDVIIDNHARNGRSSISFINEGLWQKVLDQLQPGDYVFIQFGHNDEKHDVEGKVKRFTKPGSTFDANLTRYVEETRQKGGIPVLFNCVERRLFYDKKMDSQASKKNEKEMDDETLRDVKYDDSEKINTDYLVPTHYTADGDYTEATRFVARKLGVAFVDATTISHHMENDHGAIGSRRLHVWLKPGEVASIPDGRKDNTHYSIYGAHVISNLLVDAIGEAVPELKPYVRHYEYIVSAAGRGNYMSLQEAVDAATLDGGNHTILVLDGTWKTPAKTKNINFEVRPSAVLSK